MGVRPGYWYVARVLVRGREARVLVRAYEFLGFHYVVFSFQIVFRTSSVKAFIS